MFAHYFRWIRSSAGITIMLTVLLAAVATIDRGPHVLINTAIMGGMLALVAIGLALLLGVMNVGSFVHGEYFMIGTLVAYYVFTPLQEVVSQNPNPTLAFVAPLIAIAAALLAGGLAGALTEILVFAPMRRRSRENWVMNSFLLTVGLAVLLINGHLLIFGADFKGIVRYWPGAPFSLMDVFIPRDRLYAFLLAVVIVLIFWIFMRITRTGRAIRAVSQDETGALMVGVNLSGILIFTMALGCSLASVAGASLLFLYPSYPTVGLDALYMAWYIVILVGLGNILGAFLGGFMVSLLKVVTVEYVGAGWDFVIPTALIILVLIFKPSGIFGSEVRGVLDQ
jgi:branched-chain amino acid transport system permease protein